MPACIILLLLPLLAAGAVAEETTPSPDQPAEEVSPFPIDFRKISDEELLQVLHELTPPGTEPYPVAKAIVNVLWEGEQKHKLHYYTTPYYLDHQPHGDAYISAHIGDFKKGLRNFQVFAIWAFNEDKTLQKVLIRRQEKKNFP